MQGSESGAVGGPDNGSAPGGAPGPGNGVLPGSGAAPGGRVLVVDDDAAIRRSLERGLRLSGFSVALAEDGETALARMPADAPDVLVLDVSMPGVSGAEVCRSLRARGDDIPVLMLSALDEPADRVAGLQAGADDYLVKPFALEELVLRLRALLRRRPPQPDDRVLAGPLTIDPGTRQARLYGEELRLTRREFELLTHLARNSGLVLSREQLLERVWGYDFDVRSDAVDTFVSYLRRKTEAGGRPRLIHTVRGVGFVLRLPDGADRPSDGAHRVSGPSGTGPR
ncbi:response regulator transcription factor [Kitasatospora sp. A2-31]|uniref:response regulator transcription factor n=1 Tax=Kitasatospora sp. A2-31 TaxID=2916414 RepID=UPI001EEA2AE5|nr:response regulator transcription factor [Kitasatospora sp. A2-31]MCG6494176.1 response regulator transcription factor [Kitasatospora sp. A2-31]